jgi:hypothetical protein
MMGFTGCGKTRRTCFKRALCIRARLYRLRENSQNVFQEGALCQGTTLQAAGKLAERVSRGRFVSGHDFTDCGKTRRSCLNGPLCIRARLYRLRENSQNVFQEGALCQGTTLQAAEKLVDRVSMGRFVSGHDFSRAVNATKQRRALAPEGCLPLTSPENRSFSAACLAPRDVFRQSELSPQTLFD